MLLGRFKNARQALVWRNWLSGDSAMARRYASRSLRRDSVSAGEDDVDVNHDFDGSGDGGAEDS